MITSVFAVFSMCLALVSAGQFQDDYPYQHQFSGQPKFSHEQQQYLSQQQYSHQQQQYPHEQPRLSSRVSITTSETQEQKTPSQNKQSKPKMHPLQFDNATAEFTFDLLKELSKTPGNIVFSPTSIGTLMSILQQGAQGNTKKELFSLMHTGPKISKIGYQALLQPSSQVPQVLKSNGKVEMHSSYSDEQVTNQLANKLYVNPSLTINPDFYGHLKSYGSEIGSLSGPSSAAEINQWVDNATGGHIKEIIDAQSLGPDTALVMVSALYFNGKWENNFTKHSKEKFRTSPQEFKTVPFLVAQRTLTAGRESSYKWIELPYKGNRYSMFLIAPTTAFKHNLRDLLNSMSGSTLLNIIKAKTTRNVSLKLPKFKIQQKPAIKEIIQQKVKSLFSKEANLTNIARDLYVTDIAHEAYMDVNEEGTEAAAATSVVIHTLSANWNPNDLDFRLDEPFLAFVVDKRHNVPILAARIADPSV